MQGVFPARVPTAWEAVLSDSPWWVIVALKHRATLEAWTNTRTHTHTLNRSDAECSTGVELSKTIIFLIGLFLIYQGKEAKLLQGVNTDASIFTAHEIAGWKVKQKGRIRENVNHNMEKKIKQKNNKN